MNPIDVTISIYIYNVTSRTVRLSTSTFPFMYQTYDALFKLCQHHTTLYTIPLNACRIHLTVQCPTLPTPHYAVHQLTHYIIHIAHRQYPDVSATYDAADVLHHR